MCRSKEGISGFGRTDGRTDGQPENIMPPAPKGGGIKIEMYGTSKWHLSWIYWYQQLSRDIININNWIPDITNSTSDINNSTISNKYNLLTFWWVWQSASRVAILYRLQRAIEWTVMHFLVTSMRFGKEWLSLVQMLTGRLVGTKASFEPTLSSIN